MKKYIYEFRWHITLLLIILILLNSVPNFIKNNNPTKQVLVAKKNLEIGTKLSNSDVIIKNIPNSITPKQTLISEKQIVGKQSSTFIPAGAVISNLMLSNIGTLNNIPDNRVLVTVNIENGTSLQAGNKIDILAQNTNNTDNTITDFLAKNAVIITKKNDFQIAVYRNEAEKILKIPINTKILAILVH